MFKRLFSSLIGINTIFATLYADMIYIVGFDNASKPTYWTINSSLIPSSFNELDVSTYDSGSARSVAFAPDQSAYIVGTLGISDTTGAEFWSVSKTGVASPATQLSTSDIFDTYVNSIAFNPSGTAYMVGRDGTGSAAYWTLSSNGTLSGSNPLPDGNIAGSVTFTELGNGFITGIDNVGNAVYWTISPLGVIGGPFVLVGGEAGGGAFPYGSAVSPSGVTYIVGTTTGGFPCYWTISSLGVASIANVIDGGMNSSCRSVAFLPSGKGMIVGQGSGNVSTYWNIASDGTVGTNNTLVNGVGTSSFASGVAYSSDETAYIVGQDNDFHAVYWTISPSGAIISFTQLESGGMGSALNIAIYLELAPKAPSSLSARFIKNDFALLFERCLELTWAFSTSSDVVSYNIYKDGLWIGSVPSSTNRYLLHNVRKKDRAIYEVSAVDSNGRVSEKTAIEIN